MRNAENTATGVVRWNSVLLELKGLVWGVFRKRHCYKFTGDGWIIVAPANHSDCKQLDHQIARIVSGFHQYTVDALPLTIAQTPLRLAIGVDVGFLRELKMVNRREYVGPCLNVACRLQSVAKREDDPPSCSLVASSAAAHERLFVNDPDSSGWSCIYRKLDGIDTEPRPVWVKRNGDDMAEQ